MRSQGLASCSWQASLTERSLSTTDRTWISPLHSRRNPHHVYTDRLILIGAELFVDAVERGAQVAGLPVGLVALVLAPLATELPEKLISVMLKRAGTLQAWQLIIGGLFYLVFLMGAIFAVA